MGVEHAIVVATGADAPSSARRSLRDDAYVIAADGGVDAAIALGLTVDLAIGDFDSVTVEGLAHVEASGARVERHPPAKDATDLELALDAALDLGARDVVVLGSDGGRLDHLLAAAAALSAPARTGVRISAWFGAHHLIVVTPLTPAEIEGTPGAILTLMPVNGPALGVRTEGLVYPLHDEDLVAGTSRGVSNVFVDGVAHVSLAEGVVLVVIPSSP